MQLLSRLLRVSFAIRYGIAWFSIPEMAARRDFSAALSRIVALKKKAGNITLPAQLLLFEGFLHYKLGNYPDALERTVQAYFLSKPGWGVSANEARYLKCFARALGDLIGTKIEIKGGHHMTTDCTQLDLGRIPVGMKKAFPLWTHPDWESSKGWT